MQHIHNTPLRRYVYFAVCAGVLSACATSYQPLGYGGGYHEEQMSESSWHVSFAGNVYTEAAQVRSYMLRRCAQLAQQAGYAYFTVGDESHQRQAAQTGAEVERSDLEQQTIDGYAVDRSSHALGPTLPVQPQRLDRHTDSCLMRAYRTGMQPAGALEAAAILALPLKSQGQS